MKKTNPKIINELGNCEITISAEHIRRWIKLGVINEELGEFMIKNNAGGLKEGENFQISAIEESKKQVEFIKFVLSNKNKLLKILSEEDKTFRQSREIIDNKLSIDSLDKNQLALSHGIEGNRKLSGKKTTVESVTTINLDLSPAEDRLVHTLSLLLSRKSERHDQSSPRYYLGNYESGIATINLGDIESIDLETARISISPHELYSTYLGRKDHGIDNQKFILDVLQKLAEKNFPVSLTIPSKSSTAQKKRYDKFRTFLTLFQVALINRELKGSESKVIDKSKLLSEGGKCNLLFKFGPIFTNNIRDRYVEFPEDIHLRVSRAKFSGKNGQNPQCVNLMRDLLFREKGLKRYSIVRDEGTLINMLGLRKEASAGRKSRVQERLKQCFNIFEGLGLIKEYLKTTGKYGQVQYIITINPEFK